MKLRMGRRVLSHAVRGAMLLLTVALLAACGGSSGGYPATFKSHFLTSCEAGGASAAACTCVLGVVEAHVPVDKILAFDRDLRAGHIPQWLFAARTKCLGAQTTTT